MSDIMIYSYNDIYCVHLELTSKCTVNCPMCSRNNFGGPVNSWLPITELSLNDIKKIFTEDFIKKLSHIFLCGNYGDPIIAKDMLEVLEWFRLVNPNMSLGVNTHGSARNTVWWEKLGQLLNRERDYVKFGLDGLEDTNHIYRRGTNWLKIMENVSSFISAGGTAHWDYIVFKHNEHQIEEAKILSEKMGFKLFTVKKTSRFFNDDKLEGIDKQKVYNKNSELEYYIEKPINEKYNNNSLLKEKLLIETWGSLSNYLDNNTIQCKAIEDSMIYISAEGLVFPCCWTANQLYVGSKLLQTSQIWSLINQDITNVSALYHSIQSIIEGDYFKKIYDSWYKPNIKDGKLKVCSNTCGVGFTRFKDQFI